MRTAQKLLMERKGLLGLVLFGAMLWVAVVATYAAQIRNDRGDGQTLRMIPLTNTSCSSSSSSSGGGGSLKPPRGGSKVLR
jgi:hypothetical protein